MLFDHLLQGGDIFFSAATRGDELLLASRELFLVGGELVAQLLHAALGGRLLGRLAGRLALRDEGAVLEDIVIIRRCEKGAQIGVRDAPRERS